MTEGQHSHWLRRALVYFYSFVVSPKCKRILLLKILVWLAMMISNLSSCCDSGESNSSICWQFTLHWLVAGKEVANKSLVVPTMKLNSKHWGLTPGPRTSSFRRSSNTRHPLKLLFWNMQHIWTLENLVTIISVMSYWPVENLNLRKTITPTVNVPEPSAHFCNLGTFFNGNLCKWQLYFSLVLLLKYLDNQLNLSVFGECHYCLVC